MSKLIYKKPYIETILEELSSEQLGSLKTILNGAFNPGSPIIGFNSTDYKAIVSRWENATIAQVRLMFNSDNILPGIIIKTETHWYFLRPAGIVTGPIEVYTLTVTDDVWTDFVKSKELVDVEELRRALSDTASGGDTWTSEVKPYIKKLQGGGIRINGAFSVFDEESRYIDHNATNHITSIYGGLRVGSSETPTDFELNGKLKVGNSFGTAGQVLKSTGEGAEWSNDSIGAVIDDTTTSATTTWSSNKINSSIPTGSGSRLYKHYLSWYSSTWMGVVVINNIATPYSGFINLITHYMNNTVPIISCKYGEHKLLFGRQAPTTGNFELIYLDKSDLTIKTTDALQTISCEDTVTEL